MAVSSGTLFLSLALYLQSLDVIWSAGVPWEGLLSGVYHGGQWGRRKSELVGEVPLASENEKLVSLLLDRLSLILLV